MTPCPACKGPMAHPGWGDPALLVCAACGHGWLPVAPRDYSKDYFDGSGEAGVDYEGSKRQFQLINNRRLDWMGGAYAPEGKLLELGCALGFFLEAAEARGFEGWGVEISPFAAKKAQEKFGTRVLCGTLDSLPADWSGFDSGAGFHVLEHLSDPEAVLKNLGPRLKAGAWLAWEVPDFGSRKARRGRGSWQYFLPGEHLHYYTLESLKRLHGRHGFELQLHRRTSFTRLLGGVDKAGLKKIREWVLSNLRWLGWFKSLVLALRGALGGHDCVFVLFRKKAE